jgi:hypothetical protein
MAAMNLSVGARGVMLAAGLLSASAAIPAHEPSAPLSPYGRLPYLEDVSISPDGTRLAFVRTTEDTRSLYIIEMAGGKVLGGARIGNAKLRDVFWQDNDRVFAIVSSTSPPPFGFTGPTSEWYQVVRYTISTGKLHGVDFDIDKERTFNVITGEPQVRQIDGKSALYLPGRYVGGQAVLPAMFSFGSEYGHPTIIARGNEPYTDWLLDEAGIIAAQFEYHDSRKTWTIMARHDNRMVTIASGPAPLDPPGLLGFDTAGENVIVQFMQDGDPVWRPISLKQGVLGEPLARGAALHGVIIDPRNSRIIGGVLNSDDSKYVFFDNELQAHWNAILRAFPKDTVHLASHSADFSKVILEVFGPEDGYQYAYFDWYTHRASLLGARYQGVMQIAEIRKVTYAAADGLAISGFLTLPRDLPPKKLPLIVIPKAGRRRRTRSDSIGGPRPWRTRVTRCCSPITAAPT